MSGTKWKPARSLQECNAIMTAPGQLHEMEHAVIDNRVYRVYKNIWPSVREYWRATVSLNTKVHTQEYLIFEETRINYGQADEMVQRMASMLREVYKVRKGDRVAIAMRNYPEWIIAFWAAAILGAVPTPINAWLPVDPFLHCIRLTTPKVIVVDSERLSLLSSHLPSLHLSVIVVRPAPNKRISSSRVKEWKDALSSYSGSLTAWEKEPAPLPEDNATIFFTSGTTGLPKGVLSSQRAFIGNIPNLIACVRRRELRRGTDLPPPLGQGPPLTETEQEQEAALISVPLFHVTASTGTTLMTTTFGGKIVLMRKWDKVLAGKLIKEENITSSVGVPSTIYDILESTAVGNPRINNLGTGGAPAAESLVFEMVKKFPNARVHQGYGMTETNSISLQIVGEDYIARPNSCGLPPPVVDILIVDPNTNKGLPPGKIGELWIRGPHLMREYYKDRTATEQAMTQDGWLKSGDLASMDEDGFVYIKDRMKDMIIRGGENIHSTFVENALFADPRVLDCAVVGIPDRRLGELVTAAVILRDDWRGKVSETALLDKIKPSLPAFAVPSMIHIQNERLARNAAGKVLKKELRTKLVKEWETREKSKSKL